MYYYYLKFVKHSSRNVETNRFSVANDGTYRLLQKTETTRVQKTLHASAQNTTEVSKISLGFNYICKKRNRKCLWTNCKVVYTLKKSIGRLLNL